MSDIDSDMLGFAKKEFGENCELEKRTEWSYSFRCGSKSYCSISRFMLEPGLEVSASEIRQRWPSMSVRERMDFASNFGQKKAWTDNETGILKIIMNGGDDHIWSSCALAVLRHSDRNRPWNFSWSGWYAVGPIFRGLITRRHWVSPGIDVQRPSYSPTTTST